MKFSYLVLAGTAGTLLTASLVHAQTMKLETDKTQSQKTKQRKPLSRSNQLKPVKRQNKEPDFTAPSKGVGINLDKLMSYDPSYMAKKSQQIIKVCQYSHTLSGKTEFNSPVIAIDAVHQRDILTLSGETIKSNPLGGERYVSENAENKAFKPLEAARLLTEPNRDAYTAIDPTIGTAFFNVGQTTMDWVIKAVDNKKGVCVGVNEIIGKRNEGRNGKTHRKTEGFIWMSIACRC